MCGCRFCGMWWGLRYEVKISMRVRLASTKGEGYSKDHGQGGYGLGDAWATPQKIPPMFNLYIQTLIINFNKKFHLTSTRIYNNS